MRDNEQRSDDEPRVFYELPGPAAKRYRYNLAETIRAGLRPGDIFHTGLNAFAPINSRLRLGDVIEVIGSDWMIEVVVVGPLRRLDQPFSPHVPVQVHPRDFNWHRDDVSPDAEITRIMQIERAIWDRLHGGGTE